MVTFLESLQETRHSVSHAELCSHFQVLQRVKQFQNRLSHFYFLVSTEIGSKGDCRVSTIVAFCFERVMSHN